MSENGELDIVGDIARPADIDRLSADPNLEMSLARGFHAFFLLMNNTRAPWNDRIVRQAAAQSIDRNSMVRSIYSGYCEPINGWLPPVSPWASPDGTRNIFDRAAACEKLLSCGYRFNFAGKLTAPDGRPLPKITLLAPLARVAPTTAEMAERLADSLNAAGFDVEVEPLDFSAMVARLDRKDYSLAVLGWSMGRNPDSLYSFYHSAMDVAGGYNMTGTHDAALDVITQAGILGLLRRLQREKRLTVLLVTHDLPMAASVCSRLFVMKDGRLVERGAPEDLLTAPRHPYTRRLVRAIL